MNVGVPKPYEGIDNSAFPYEEPKYLHFDPFLGYAKSRNSLPGYDVWPPGQGITGKDVVVVTLGGSTTDSACAKWPEHLGKLLREKGLKTLVLNGGVAGYSSSQELIKLMRDLPAIRPDFVVNLSGINDFTWGHTRPENPYLHTYQRRVSQHLCDTTDAFEDWVGGAPHRDTKSTLWLRNVRLMKAICDDINVNLLSCLQPTMVLGDYQASEEEKKVLLEPFMHKTINDNTPYFEVARKFYEEIQSAFSEQPETYRHCCDLSRSYAGMSGLYRDYRHQNEAGDIILANAIASELYARFNLV